MPTSITGESGVSQVQNNTITQADLTTAVLPLGVGQSWSNMTALRTINTDYTNDTGRPILVSVISTNVNATNFAIFVGGMQVANASVNANPVSLTVQAVVPSGATYKVIFVTGGVSAWLELR